MGLLHGDNTGLYRAERLMARMYRRFGREGEATRREDWHWKRDRASHEWGD